MKIVRFISQDNTEGYGVLDGGLVRRLEGDIFSEGAAASGAVVEVKKLLAPIVPTQILCIGLNYRKHAQEAGAAIPERPILFVKGVNTLLHPGDPIELPRHLRSDEVDYEAELAVVIGRAGKNIPKERALDHVLGYTCCNDVSARDHQLKLGGGQWCRGKFFDTFAPLGPVLVTPSEIPDPNNLAIAARLNGEVVQRSHTSDMIFDVRTLISYLSASTTLIPGTVILTGTPPGVGMARKPQPRFLQPGDSVEIEIEGIGCLQNPVQAEAVTA